jgi:hypothetical protein
MDEIEAMKLIDETMTKINDSAVRNRIMQWAWNKFSTESKPSTDTKGSTSKKTKRKSAERKSKSKTTLSIVKDLNLKPSGKKSLAEFADVKKPSSNLERLIVSAYYLQHELKHAPIDANDVFTCFKHMNWRKPADIAGKLRWIASQKGWLDTSNTNDIKTTPHGENFVEHDLPKKAES